MKRANLLKNIDWFIVGLYIAMITVGWINIYAANYQPDHLSIFDSTMEYGKQFRWLIGAGILIFIILMLDSGFIINISIPVYVTTIVLLLAVLIFGKEVNGAKSWFGFGSFGIQPSEFAKVGVAMALARYLSLPTTHFYDMSAKLIAYLIIIIPSVLIALQPDIGTVLVFAAFILTLYREGLSGNILLLGILAIILSVISLLFKPIIVTLPYVDVGIPGQYVLVFFIIIFGLISYFGIKLFVFPRYRKNKYRLLLFGFIGSLLLTFSVDRIFEKGLDDHQKTRINILLGLEEDPLGAGYNVNQSKTAIGSGKIIGKGFLKGQLTKYKYVPMQSTDFIFCTIGEEWGFVGSSVIVILFMLLLVRIIIIAERQKQPYVRIYAYSVSSILFLHFLINIGMAIGLAPVIGIPLPFFSYGGSSLWSFTILIFILVRLDADRVNFLR
jgi:rod shape determining protein RodA